MALVGPTASGKSALALELARRHAGLEIVSIDSMQVYRGMDIGTAKPTAAEQAEVRHHLIDLVDPSDAFTAAQFQQVFRGVMDDLDRRGVRALLVGGTGLHLRMAIDGFDIPGRFSDVRAGLDEEPDTSALYRRLVECDPLAASRMEPTNRRRIVRALEVTLGSGRPFSSFGPGLDTYAPTTVRLVGLQLTRPELDQRIERRYADQMAAGFLDEVRDLAARPGGMSSTARQALGYRELLEHLEGGVALDEAVERAVTRTRRFARRQERWFRRDPRIVWFEVGSGHNPLGAVEALLED